MSKLNLDFTLTFSTVAAIVLAIDGIQYFLFDIILKGLVTILRRVRSAKVVSQVGTG